ncbi:transglutaminaseTgpA domain-containing protein [Sporosarcina contaminans]|uniref:TransglutaminaseTgpA domain-containing protein n=1 Tax=Sporosarcina contaminans TaxID=633403 RepID=A0ABW3TZ89_9BACL
MGEDRLDKRFLLLMYALSFLLLREWLLPVMALTDTNYLGVFLVFIALSFLIGIVRMRWWFSIPIKAFYILWSLHFIYFHTPLLSIQKINILFTNLFSNVSMIANGDWDNITNPFRTLLFFVLLWMTIYLIRHWVEVRKNILLFYAATVVFIAFLDTFSPYEADGAIFRIMVSGLLLIGFLFIMKLYEKHERQMSGRLFALLSLPMLFAVGISGAFASLMPERAPAWPDPVPFIKSMASGEGAGLGNGAYMAQSGYDPDDSKLGGPFAKDDTVVFKATVPQKQYWKIETKNTYTSKGWEQVSGEVEPAIYAPGTLIANDSLETEDMAGKTVQAEIQMSEVLPFIVYPYGTTKINTRSDVVLLNEEDSGRFWAVANGEKIALDTFVTELKEPEYSLKALRETSMADYELERQNFSQYLQLPEQLPDRVRELAKSIAEKEESVYEKAKAIERYFARNGFTYDQYNVATPKGNEDYVDQFLFETKNGYCDNFSTSMVVMLRAVDIPARWVKGFAPGESKLNSRGEREHTITNNEAHSWVEAYMPGIGWMPFEPTIGFSNLSGIRFDLDLDITDPEAPDMEEKELPEKTEQQKIEPTKASKGVSTVVEAASKWVNNNKWYVMIGMLIIGSAIWKFYSVRGKWLPKVVLRTLKTEQGDWRSFVKQYKSLLKQLERFGLKRTNGMTLSEYAKTVDTYFGGNKMSMLTKEYEKGLYGGQTDIEDWHALQKIWEDLINRATG